MDKSINIYVIDDDAIYQFAMKRILEGTKLPTTILPFSDGEEAFTSLTQNATISSKLPDIIFLDINMPIMDGWQFLEEYEHIKSQLLKKPTIYLVSSSVDPADVERAKNIPHVVDYLIKPLAPARLKEVIEAAENAG